MNWEKYFNDASRWAYQAVPIPEGCGIHELASMEAMYQAFKARFLEETSSIQIGVPGNLSDLSLRRGLKVKITPPEASHQP